MRTLGLALLVALASAAPAAAKKPDLIVSSGNAKLENGTVTGSFVVSNKGGKATVSAAAVAMTTPGYVPAEVAAPEVKGIKKSGKRTIPFSGPVPDGIKPLLYRVRVCADPYGGINESNEKNNCRKIADVQLDAPPSQAAPATPSGPVEYAKDSPLQLESGQSSYWVAIPQSYDDTHKTPTPLLVWMHGCGGDSGGDIYTVGPTGNAAYLAISIGGRDGGCWDMEDDPAKVLAAITNVSTHFNVNKRRVVIGGFSSGGDLAYRTAFFNSTVFAGVLGAGTTPFRDIGAKQEDAIAAATNKFHVVQLAATDDEVYQIATVRKETDAMKSAGFPVELVERAGTHYDDKTDANIMSVLLPHMADNWLAP